MPTCGVLFAKKPEPGKVKTRLQTHCSSKEAAELYRAFVLDCATTLAESRAERKVVAYAPDDAGEPMEELLSEIDRFEMIAQPDLDLGGRMKQVAQWSFASGATRTVIIGSDSPSLPVSHIDQALDLLQERDVVLGPSTDGGYYLVGLRAGETRIFTDVEWSTGRVLEQTLDRLGTQSLGLLPPWYDVDSAESVIALTGHLAALEQSGIDNLLPATWQFLSPQ